MDKRLLIFLLCLCLPAVVAAGMYKWEDENGKVHYTDQPPTENAEELSLPPLNSYKPPELPSKQEIKSEIAEAPEGQPDAKVAKYEKLTITSPEMNATIRNNAGNVPIAFTLTPAGGLQAGHEYRLILDGRPLKQDGTTLTNVDRGSHTVKLQIVDANGVPQLSSQAVIFHLHREADGKKTTDAMQPDDNSDAYTPSNDNDFTADEDDAVEIGDGSSFDPTNITDPEDTRDSVYDPESSGYDSGSTSSGNYTPSSTPNYSPNYSPNYNQNR